VAEPTERVPRVTCLLALALKFEEMVRTGVVSNYAVLAQLGQVTRSRVTQMTNLLNLAPTFRKRFCFWGRRRRNVFESLSSRCGS